MKKAGLTIAAILAGCSLQTNAPEARHVEAQPSAAQPAPFSHRPENYALVRCDYKLTMDTWGYTIECNNEFTKIRLDHSEWAPESVVYDGNCNERLFFEIAYEGTQGKAKWIDYHCDGDMDTYIQWALVQREGYEIFAPGIIESPAQDWKNGFDFLKTAIGAEKTDAAWRFRYHVPARGAL